jgi:hypothetical protein
VATHAHRFGTLDLPRPSRAALPLVALALLALALEAAPQLRLAGAAAAACFALARWSGQSAHAPSYVLFAAPPTA